MRPIALLLLVGCADVHLELGDAPRPLPTDPSVEPSARVIELPLVCEAPASQAPVFDSRLAGEGLGGEGRVGGALFVGDLDGDHALDLGEADAWRSTAFLNRGGEFARDSCFYGFDLEDATALAPADVDGDGDLDLFVARADAPQTLLRNDSELGGLAFTDISAESGFGQICGALVAAWADVDGDGDLDLFTGGPDPADAGRGQARLYVQDNGVFADASHRLPDAVYEGPITAGAWFDPDRDGLPDLYLVRSEGDHDGNLLLRNDGLGGLERDHNALGLDVRADGTGLAIGDLNGDQTPDLVIAERGGLQVRMSRDGWWEEVSHEIGLRPGANQHDPWGVDLGDVDNDGDLDVALRFGPEHPGELGAQPDALFLQEDGQFADRAAELGVDDRGVGRGLVLADVNDDGWLDLAGRDLDGPSQLHLSRCGAERFLRIELVQPGANRDAIGARVRVIHGDQVQVRTVRAGGLGFASSGPPELHVGLGDIERVDRVEVTWPDGRVNRFEDVLTSQRLLVIRDE